MNIYQFKPIAAERVDLPYGFRLKTIPGTREGNTVCVTSLNGADVYVRVFFQSLEILN